MRTSEEIRQWAVDRPDECLPYGACRQCILDLIRFIDSDPPCTHPRLVKVFKGYWCLLGYAPMGQAVKYCPDCGEKLKEKD